MLHHGESFFYFLLYWSTMFCQFLLCSKYILVFKANSRRIRSNAISCRTLVIPLWLGRSNPALGASGLQEAEWWGGSESCMWKCSAKQPWQWCTEGLLVSILAGGVTELGVVFCTQLTVACGTCSTMHLSLLSYFTSWHLILLTSLVSNLNSVSRTFLDIRIKRNMTRNKILFS